jgi:flagellar basal-body rod modification protein FlgD
MVGSVSNTNTYEKLDTNAAKGKSSLGKDDFLSLMITQLKNQDPLNPTDSSQYASQLAQFSSLEQLTNINDNLTTSINANAALSQSINNTMAANLIGKEVKISGDTITNNGQDSINLGYTLPAQAKSVEINIIDSSGKTVKTINSSYDKAGDHKIKWEFTDDNGDAVPQGEYTFKITATSTSNSDLTVSQFKYGTIDAVKFGESGTTVAVDGVDYNISDIAQITNDGDGGK